MSDIDKLVPERLIRAKKVAELTGLNPSTIYKYRERGLFPDSVSIGTTVRVWPLSVVNKWIADRVAGVPLADGTHTFPFRRRSR
ncbi:MAG: AlpA family phage regulatory protein [Deltaproteobacteria bacterium]|jgi:prophage regulatory protein|nr:AlpA family phage regulatory protein [Deltaproteobacteria bacterium]